MSVRLAEVCTQDRQQSNTADALAAGLPFVGMESISGETGDVQLGAGSRTGEGASASFLFDDSHVLFGKLRPYLRKTAAPELAGCCSTELIPLRPDLTRLTRRYLFHWLRNPTVVKTVSDKHTGARMPRADMNVLMQLELPLPCLDEQQVIVDRLDAAADIRRRAKAARDKARALTQALFLDMFGDPVTNPKGWRIVAFGAAAEDITRLVPAVQRRDYSAMGAFPIRDQGQVEIAGYTDDEMSTVEFDDPVILFGDHTRVFRLALNRFARGADGVKVLRALVGFDPCYLTAYWIAHGVPSHGYSRHFKFLKAIKIARPPIVLQQAFADRVEIFEALTARLAEAEQQAEAAAAALSAEVFG